MVVKIKIDGSQSISEIIRHSVSTRADLEKLCRKLGLNVSFDWIDNYNKNEKYQILNIDADHIGGTHWIAVFDNKFYFDPLGFAPAREQLSYLQWTPIDIQDADFGGCGLYCVLFLWYAKKDDIEGFYSLF